MTAAPETTIAHLRSRVKLYRRWTIALGALAAFLLVVVVGQSTLGQSPAAAPAASSPAAATPAPASSDSPIVRREEGDPMAIGDLDALVVVTMWTDLRCPFCAAFDRGTLPVIVEEYVDAGLVRLEVNDVAFFGEQSEDAAVAARAAANQDSYFAYLAAVFAAAPESGHADLPREKLIAFAETVGIRDLDRFTADLDDPALRAAAQQTTATAQQLGVTSVPFFVAGNTALAGAQPVDVFRDYLDAAVEQAR